MNEQIKVIRGVPSSFVFNNMKLDTDKGSGEAKLFIGPTKKMKKLDDFFKFNAGYKYKFEKQNLLDYLREVKMEYVFQNINKYKSANLKNWTEFFSKVSDLEESELYVKLTKFSDQSRVYVRAQEYIFNKIFRKITVPKLTDVEFIRDDTNKLFKILLHVNYEYKVDDKVSSVDIVNYNTKLEMSYPPNRILFGAPGTGKSYTLNKEAKELLGEGNEDDYERVTFHPDYSYAHFVGIYKPVMVSESVAGLLSDDDKEIIRILKDENLSAQEKYDSLYNTFNERGTLSTLPLLLSFYTDETFHTRKADGSGMPGDNGGEQTQGKRIRPFVEFKKAENLKKDISYEYVPGPFMRMYVKALKNARTDNPRPFLLIIEEINRANAAAVFGDIFQLLDRDDDGVSDYPIEASEDIKNYLVQELGGHLEDYSKIRIPNNLFIWATMNSADQGVFPMDTAFKRRWDFTYLGINDSEDGMKGKYVYLGKDKSQKVEWNSLRKAINDYLAKEKVNEDKQLGPYFLSKKIIIPKDGDEIDRDNFIKTFKSKVIMYLFEDAAKHKPSLFDGCGDKANRYSEICKQFDEKGIKIFNKTIQDNSNVEDTQLDEE